MARSTASRAASSTSRSSGGRPTEKPKPVWVSLALGGQRVRRDVRSRRAASLARTPVVEAMAELGDDVAVLGGLEAGDPRVAGPHGLLEREGEVDLARRSVRRPRRSAAGRRVGGRDTVGFGQAGELVGLGERGVVAGLVERLERRTSSSSEPAEAKPWRPSRMTRTPTPSVSAMASDSISPSYTRTSVSWSTTRRRPRPARRRRPSRRRGRRSRGGRLSAGGAADGQGRRPAGSARRRRRARPGRPCRTCPAAPNSKSLPSASMFWSTSGPLPMRLPSRSGSVISPFSMR